MTKVHRAFPELDAFSDEQCRGFVRLAVREHTASMIGIGLLAVALVVGIIAGGFVGIVLLGRAVLPLPRYEMEMFGSALVAPTVVAGLLGFKVRDVWLRRLIHRAIESGRCPACSYSLLGLEVVEGRVLCPECGTRTTLAERRLTPGMLIATGVK